MFQSLEILLKHDEITFETHATTCLKTIESY
jgi:hypothetical protein